MHAERQQRRRPGAGREPELRQDRPCSAAQSHAIRGGLAARLSGRLEAGGERRSPARRRTARSLLRSVRIEMPEDGRRMGPVAERVAQRVEDQSRARPRRRSGRRASARRPAARPRPGGRALRAGCPRRSICVAARQQHRAVDAVLELADIAAPAHGRAGAPSAAATERPRAAGRWLGRSLAAKCWARAAMSSGRSRSGGRCRLTTLRRNSRSSRNVPSATARSRSRLLVAIRRMSTLIGRAAADPVDLALLDGAQQLGLQARLHLADLVEQQRAAAAPPRTCRSGARRRR